MTILDLIRAFEALPDMERKVATLRKVYELTLPEIAIHLHITEEEAERLMKEALKKLGAPAKGGT